MSVRRILFLTGTRADYGKLKPLMRAVEDAAEFECQIFVTGMHTLKKYGYTAIEVSKDGFTNQFVYMNQHHQQPMEEILANTITGLSRYLHENRPDLLVVHGDRVEALAGAIVGSINNVPVAHIEGGEKSGTIDEHIRHAVTKMSHIHFVCNEEAKRRLIQMGEDDNHIYDIGSPDIDVMLDEAALPSLSNVIKRYEIPFSNYGILLYHPVTTDLDNLDRYVKNLVSAVKLSGRNFIVIYPNNDEGSLIIQSAYNELLKDCHFKIFPSIKFEYFLSLLKHCEMIIGNSSAGIREAPVYGVPSINVGNRQSGRAASRFVRNVNHDVTEIRDAICNARRFDDEIDTLVSSYGRGDSVSGFLSAIADPAFWDVNIQKAFVDK
jgi:UDP-N-acetylglucosamine 2-epimerase (hydrolysing)